jgi:hypothetical protein
MIFASVMALFVAAYFALSLVAAEAAVPKTVMINATFLKARRTGTSLRSKKGGQATKEAV